MLLPNSTMTQYQMSTFSAILPQNDGILLVRPLGKHGEHERKAVLFRILLADSGHYVLPIGRFQDKADPKEQAYLRKALQNYLDETLYADRRDTDRQSTQTAMYDEQEVTTKTSRTSGGAEIHGTPTMTLQTDFETPRKTVRFDLPPDLAGDDEIKTSLPTIPPLPAYTLMPHVALQPDATLTHSATSIATDDATETNADETESPPPPDEHHKT